MIEGIIRQYDFNLKHAELLVSDLNQEQMTQVPSLGFENHPAFTLGHLVSGSEVLLLRLTDSFQMPEGWENLFRRNGPGDPRIPSTKNELYPSKDDLIKVLTSSHNNVKNCIRNIPLEELTENIEWRFSKHLPTKLDLIVFLCITHESLHLGQLAAWRRAMNLPSVFNKL